MPAPWTRGARVVVQGRLHGQITNNVLHFATNTQVNDGGPLDALLLALADAVLECFITSFIPCVTQDWAVEQVEAFAIHPTLSDPVVATAGAGEVGQGGTTNVSFASSLVQVRTGGGGRHGRGRMFLPPAGDADMTQSTLSTDHEQCLVGFLTCIAGKFMGDNKTTDWNLGVLSRTQLKAVGGTFDNSFRIATQLTPRHLVAELSSRKVGKGS